MSCVITAAFFKYFGSSRSPALRPQLITFFTSSLGALDGFGVCGKMFKCTRMGPRWARFSITYLGFRNLDARHVTLDACNGVLVPLRVGPTDPMLS
jgi:hypothetical protein